MKVEFYNSQGKDWVEFICPGCKQVHRVNVFGDGWGFNKDINKPTLTPSILVRSTVTLTDEEIAIVMAGGKVEPRKLVCHSFVKEGKIEFLNDCTHSKAGTTVELDEIREA